MSACVCVYNFSNQISSGNLRDFVICYWELSRVHLFIKCYDKRRKTKFDSVPLSKIGRFTKQGNYEFVYLIDDASG